MAKPGRNDPCSCGSGKKYKRCCLPVHEPAAAPHATAPPMPCPQPAWPIALIDDDDDDLDELSNSVVDLLKAGRINDAETACLELRRRHPAQIDWLERTAMVHEARGDKKTAAEYCRKCVAFTLANPDGFNEDSRAWMKEKIRELDPAGPAGPQEG